MREFLVCFYQHCERTFDGEVREFKPGEIIRVSEREMFSWLEHAHHDRIKITIYEAKVICDLS